MRTARKRKRHSNPLKRADKPIYWKGKLVDDDNFLSSPKKVKEYNRYMRKLRRVTKKDERVRKFKHARFLLKKKKFAR